MNSDAVKAMSLNQKINEDIKHAMKAKDSVRTSCLRMLKAALKNMQVEKRRDLGETEIQFVISSQIKKGTQAAEEFRKGGREDLALKEDQEVKILYAYLPRQLTPEQIEGTIHEIISELSANNAGDIGRVMHAAMERMAGQAQGKQVSEIARKFLS